MDNFSPTNVPFGRAASGICVRDIEAACSFYSKFLEFKKVFANRNPTGFMVLRKDDAERHLILKRHHQATTNTVAHIFVDNAATLYSLCQAAGVRIIRGLADKHYGQQAFVLADPNGNRIDIGERMS